MTSVLETGPPRPLPEPSVATSPRGLRIAVARGVGRGPTELAAFDAALHAAGVANFNLIALSSVIPPASVVDVVDRPIHPPGEWGDRLYVVLAERRTSTPGDVAAAAIGWVTEPASGRGLFVEHDGASLTEVEADARASLDALADVRGGGFGPPTVVGTDVRCDDAPVCALVVAVYGSVPWHPAHEVDLR